jgi:hypothetical protein
MTLAIFWFIVLAVLWTGFLLLEGFDFGVGMLHGVVGRDEEGRSLAIRTVGPVWDVPVDPRGPGLADPARGVLRVPVPRRERARLGISTMFGNSSARSAGARPTRTDPSLPPGARLSTYRAVHLIAGRGRPVVLRRAQPGFCARRGTRAGRRGPPGRAGRVFRLAPAPGVLPAGAGQVSGPAARTPRPADPTAGSAVPAAPSRC